MASSIQARSTVKHLGRPLHYQGDGSGRDSYIRYNHGGLISPGPSKSFGKVLRQYDRTSHHGFSRSPSIQSIEKLSKNSRSPSETQRTLEGSFRPPATKFAKHFEAMTGEAVLPYEAPEPDIF